VIVVGVMFGGASKFFAVLIGLDGWVGGGVREECLYIIRWAI
jgi:hypothetical protein